MAFDGWINSCKVHDYVGLKNLLLPEQFKVSVPMEVYHECDVTSPLCAAELAEGDEVAHGGQSGGLTEEKTP